MNQGWWHAYLYTLEEQTCSIYMYYVSVSPTSTTTGFALGVGGISTGTGVPHCGSTSRTVSLMVAPLDESPAVLDTLVAGGVSYTELERPDNKWTDW